MFAAVDEPMWDERKDRRNRARRRVGFDEAASALADEYRVTWADIEHSADEDRHATVGFTNRGRLVLVITAFEKGGRMRVVSARRPTGRERIAYATRRPPT
jgi:uncharacterized DUF497 family protein